MGADVVRRPRRVLVIGVTGSGKSVLARRVAARRGLRVVDGDAILWLPGWVRRPEDEQRTLLEDAIAADDWVLDGLRTAWTATVLARVDLVVGLDLPRALSLARLLRRTVRRLITRERFANGNTEDLRETLSRDSILVWHARSFTRRRDLVRRLAADPGGPPVVHLRSRRAIERWLVALEPATGPGPAHDASAPGPSGTAT